MRIPDLEELIEEYGPIPHPKNIEKFWVCHVCGETAKQMTAPLEVGVHWCNVCGTFKHFHEKCLKYRHRMVANDESS